MKRKRIPAWYRLYLERRVKKLQTALTWLDVAEDRLNKGLTYYAHWQYNKAKQYSK